MPFITVENFTVNYADTQKSVVDHVYMSMQAGQVTALIGESGSGKTTLAYGILGLLCYQKKATVSGQIIFQENAFDANSPDLANLRGKQIGYIFQEPLLALNPLYTIGAQIVEMLVWHKIANPRSTALDWLERVGLAPVERAYRLYPHQMSGGMRQRAMIALVMAAGPEMVIADEPTSGIDAVLKTDIINLLTQLSDTKALLLITHDLAVASQYSQKLYVMKSGSIVESGNTTELVSNPKHKYTRLLIDRYHASMNAFMN